MRILDPVPQLLLIGCKTQDVMGNVSFIFELERLLFNLSNLGIYSVIQFTAESD